MATMFEKMMGKIEGEGRRRARGLLEDPYETQMEKARAREHLGIEEPTPMPLPEDKKKAAKRKRLQQRGRQVGRARTILTGEDAGL